MYGYGCSISGRNIDNQWIEDKHRFQMVLLKTLNKRNQLMSVATKIGIQISAKLGGEIWSVPIPVLVYSSFPIIDFFPHCSQRV